MQNESMKNYKNIKLYANIKDVSEYTGLPVKSLYELSSLGKVPSIKLGRRVLFDLHDIDKMMEGMKRTCNKEEEIVNNIIGDINGN